jgi:hypothetical protein
MALPLMFTFSGSITLLQGEAIPTAANASLIWTKSGSLREIYSRAKAFAMTLADCSCSVESGPATTTAAPTSAIPLTPSCWALAPTTLPLIVGLGSRQFSRDHRALPAA